MNPEKGDLLFNKVPIYNSCILELTNLKLRRNILYNLWSWWFKGFDMGVHIKMAALLRQYTDCPGMAEVNGSTVGECLDDLIRQCPQTKNWLFDRNGTLLVFIRINNEDTAIHHRDDLSRPAKNGDELYLYLLLGGG